MTVEVLNEAGAALPNLEETELVALTRHVLDALRVHPRSEVSILLVDEPVMAALHEKWLGEPGPTDVLSFPMDEMRPARVGELAAPGQLGDIVLCPQVAARQAKTAGHSTAEELLLLTTHGVLHLLGFDHAEPGGEAEMFSLQRQLLLTFLAGR